MNNLDDWMLGFNGCNKNKIGMLRCAPHGEGLYESWCDQGGQFAKADAPIELRVYSGQDAMFELYENEGNSYRYEDGEFKLTKLVWSEKEQNIKIYESVGIYPGMITDREYEIHLIRK